MSNLQPPSQYQQPSIEVHLKRFHTRNYEEEWHQQSGHTISKERALGRSYIKDMADADAHGFRAHPDNYSDERVRQIYFYFEVLLKFPDATRPNQRAEWKRIWQERPYWGTGNDPAHTRRIIRRAYYLFESHPDLAREFAAHLPDGFRMPIPRKYHGPTFDIMDPRLDPVRERIWSYLLQSNKHGIEPAGQTGELKNFLLGSTTPVLFRLDKETSAETTRIMYEQSRFIFAFDEGARAFFWFMKDMRVSNMKSLRRIDLVFNARTYLETTDIFASAALRWFIGDHGGRQEDEVDEDGGNDKPEPKKGKMDTTTTTTTGKSKGKGKATEANPAPETAKGKTAKSDKSAAQPPTKKRKADEDEDLVPASQGPAKKRRTGEGEEPAADPDPDPAGQGPSKKRKVGDDEDLTGQAPTKKRKTGEDDDPNPDPDPAGQAPTKKRKAGEDEDPAGEGPPKKRKTGEDRDPLTDEDPAAQGPPGGQPAPGQPSIYPWEADPIARTVATLRELRITIKGDVLFTETDHILIVPCENPKVPHSVDSVGKLRDIQVTRPDGREVVINAKPLTQSTTEQGILGVLDPLQTTGTKGKGKVAPGSIATAGGGGADVGGSGGVEDNEDPGDAATGTRARGRGRGRGKGAGEERGKGKTTADGGENTDQPTGLRGGAPRRGRGRGTAATGQTGGDPDPAPAPGPAPVPGSSAATVPDEPPAQEPEPEPAQEPSPDEERERNPSPSYAPPPRNLSPDIDLDRLSPSTQLPQEVLDKLLARQQSALTNPADPNFIPTLFTPPKLLILTLCAIKNVAGFRILGTAMPISLRNRLYSQITPSKRDFISRLGSGAARTAAQAALDRETNIPLTLNDMRRVRYIPGSSNNNNPRDNKDASNDISQSTGEPVPTSNERRFVLGVLGAGWTGGGGAGSDDWFSDDGLDVFGDANSRVNRDRGRREIGRRRREIAGLKPWGEFAVEKREEEEVVVSQGVQGVVVEEEEDDGDDNSSYHGENDIVEEEALDNGGDSDYVE